MANSLLTSYLNISKLLELTPNTNEYNYHRTIMSKEEIDVAKQIKKKRATAKHRALKKLNISKTGNTNEISTVSQNEAGTDSENVNETVDSELSDSYDIQLDSYEIIDKPTNEAVTRNEHETIVDGEVSDRNETTDDPENETVLHDEHKNEIISQQVADNSEVEATTTNEAEIETISSTSEPQVFQIYDDADEIEDEISDKLDELTHSFAEQYHSIMDEATFKQFLKLQQKVIQLTKTDDTDELEMAQSQLTNMMDVCC